ncbi:MAG: thioredoxin family protein [Candidatus Aureabacteria bacterium]|nr:thioredoxin family protein [Candidatus Auribacterota bacterium]
MRIEVLGTGCPKCHKVKENVRAALAELNKEAEVIEVKDLKAISAYGVMFTPALVVNGEVKTAGKIPSVEDVKRFLATST